MQQLRYAVLGMLTPFQTGWRSRLRLWASQPLLVLAIGLLASAAAPQRGVAEDWLQWGGPNGDFTVDVKGLAETWPEAGPKQLWKRALGDGYSAILYKEGQLYTAYLDGNEGVIVSLDAGTGETTWAHRYPHRMWPETSRQFGSGPNATPLIVDDRIVAISIDGRVRCLDLASGSPLWERDLPAEFGRQKRMEEYGYSNNPMLYQGKIIVHVGGDRFGLIALSPKDGSTVWRSGPDNVSYAPPSILNLAGQDQFIYFSPEGVNALDPSTGKNLWRFEIELTNGNHLTPVVKCDENHIWVSSQFSSGGGRLLEITKGENGLQAKQEWFKSKFRGSCWTLIRIGDWIYGSAGGHNTSLLTAINWRTQETGWRKREAHMAQCLYADDKLIFLDQAGNLSIARISPEKLDVLSTVQVTESVSWTLPTLVSTNLYVRDRKHILAFDLSIAANKPGR